MGRGARRGRDDATLSGVVQDRERTYWSLLFCVPLLRAINTTVVVVSYPLMLSLAFSSPRYRVVFFFAVVLLLA